MSTIEKHCAGCGKPMKVRLADHKRGWGKFCSKSCKAAEQTRRTGNAGPGYEKPGYAEPDPRPMSQAELAAGGYGDADRNSEFGDDKWRW